MEQNRTEQKPKKIIQNFLHTFFLLFFSKDTPRKAVPVFVMLDENLNGELILGYKSCTYLVHRWLCHGIIFHYEHNDQEKFVKASPYFLLHQAILFGFLPFFEFQLLNLEHSINQARPAWNWPYPRKPTSAAGWIMLSSVLSQPAGTDLSACCSISLGSGAQASRTKSAKADQCLRMLPVCEVHGLNFPLAGTELFPLAERGVWKWAMAEHWC